MQPEPFQIIRLHASICHVIGDMFANQWQDFFENLASVLHELHVAPVFHLVVGPTQKPVVIANVVRKLGRAAGGFDFEVRLAEVFVTFKNGCSGHVSKDKVTIAVPPFEVG